MLRAYNDYAENAMKTGFEAAPWRSCLLSSPKYMEHPIELLPQKSDQCLFLAYVHSSIKGEYSAADQPSIRSFEVPSKYCECDCKHKPQARRF